VNTEEIQRAVCGAGLRPLSADALGKFADYFDLLQKWNQRLNLTAIREPIAILNRHLLECIQCAQELPDLSTLLDFGSGAGFPGIPIAILRPEIRITLGESQVKKASFLREAVRLLSLSATIYDRRIESMEPGRRFDAVTMRAVDKMTEALPAAVERLQPDGWLVVFATESTAVEFQSATAQITWTGHKRMAAMNEGLLITGRKTG
jgi:16S rRNA (guanine527-N7)-methyltransferase